MNPLAWFRENQKTTVAFFTVLLMGGFGALGVLSSVQNNNAGPKSVESKNVVNWNGGDITDQKLREVWHQRQVVQEFQQRLYAAAVQKGAGQTVPFPRLVATSVSPTGSGKNAERIGFSETMSFLCLEKEAESLGVVVTDEILMRKILNGTGGVLSEKEIKKIAGEIDRGVNLGSILKMMRREFLAGIVLNNLTESVVPVSNSPYEAFMAYERLNRKADCSLIEVNVADYLSKVGTPPGDAELKKIFEEGRYRVKDGTGEKPGFRAQRKVSIGYFQADIESITKKMLKDISDEDAKAEYDRLVKEKNPIVVVPKKPVDDTNLNPLPGTGAADSKDGKKDVPLTGPAKAGDKSSDLPPTPKMEKGKEEKKAEEKTSGETKKKEDGNSQVKRGNIHYVSLQDKKQESTEKKEGEKKSSQEAEKKTPPAEKKSSAAAEGDKKTEANQETAKPNSLPTETPNPAATVQKDEFKPFEEVKDQIKRRLVEPKVAEHVKKTFDKIRTEYVDEEKYKYFDYRSSKSEAEANGTEEPSKPSAFDSDSVVKQFEGFSYHSLPLMSYEEMEKTEVGKMRDFSGGSVAGRLYFSGYFEESGEFEILDVAAPVSDSYMIFLLEKRDAGVATFEEMKDEVVDFWKNKEALKLAMADAEKKAKQVRDSGKKLLEVFEDGKETGSFSWYRIGFSQQGGSFRRVLELSRPSNTEFVGPKFFKTVFGMKVGDVGVAPNVSNKIVYVVQKNAGSLVPLDKRMEDFFTTWNSQKRYPQGGEQFGGDLVTAGLRKILAELRDKYDVKFLD